jgi:hypothetical protein
MSDIFREVDEALREDRVKTLWVRHGRLIIAAAAVLLAGFAAYVGWTNYTASRDRQASDALAAGLAQIASDPAAAGAAFVGVAESGDADHRALARLYDAKVKLDAGDRAGAVALYRDVAADSGAEGIYRDLARLLAILHDTSTGDPAALEAALGPIAADGNPWRFSARELQGVLALRQNDRARARTIFGGLAEDQGAPAGIRGRASEILATLGE